jgi:hypothetical protein
MTAVLPGARNYKDCVANDHAKVLYGDVFNGPVYVVDNMTNVDGR